MAREPIKPEACATCGWSELRGVDLCSVCGAHHTDLPRARQRQPRALTGLTSKHVSMRPADELRLERLQSALGCSASEAIRRAVAEALEKRT